MTGTIENRPRSRGVTQLMYVGDDDAVENALAVGPMTIAGAAALAYAVFGPKKTRTAAAVAGAALVLLGRR